MMKAALWIMVCVGGWLLMMTVAGCCLVSVLAAQGWATSALCVGCTAAAGVGRKLARLLSSCPSYRPEVSVLSQSLGDPLPDRAAELSALVCLNDRCAANETRRLTP